MEPIGGDLARHDHEFEEVRWLDLADAEATLTFETERGLVARAAELLEPAELLERAELLEPTGDRSVGPATPAGCPG
jgi:hypothetical protein